MRATCNEFGFMYRPSMSIARYTGRLDAGSTPPKTEDSSKTEKKQTATTRHPGRPSPSTVIEHRYFLFLFCAIAILYIVLAAQKKSRVGTWVPVSGECPRESPEKAKKGEGYFVSRVESTNLT